MGKVSVSSNKQTHNPLYRDITDTGGKLRAVLKKLKSKAHQEEEGFVDAASSRKILQLAKEQQEELEEEENAGVNITKKFRFQADSEDEEVSEEEYEEMSDYDDQELGGDEEREEIDEEDSRMFQQYLSSQGKFDGFQSFNLADKIMAQIDAKKAQEEEQQEAVPEKGDEGVMLPPKVIAAYTQVGSVLATWTHGKLPKLFKIIPSLTNWEDVLYVTNPDKWSPSACYVATRLFVSNLGSKEAEKYISMVLLNRFRDNIEQDESHHLNYHLYQSLKKSLYKPGAFFKGFLFPLAESGCTNREAMIAGSILSKVSIPVLHSSVALSYLLKLDFNPATTLFIRVLLEKKYALPYQIVDDVVFYFMKFRHLEDSSMAVDQEDQKDSVLPVVWYKAFLAFAQRYKNDITDDQRDFLLETIRQRFHKSIGPEIRRELLAGKPRLQSVKETEPVMIDTF